MNRLSPTQLGYIAGMIDGEGCFAATKTKGSSAGAGSVAFVVSVASTYKPVLDYLRTTTGLGKVYLTNKPRSAKHKQGYAWVLNANALRELLPDLAHLLQTKRRQGEAYVRMLEITDPGGWQRDPKLRAEKEKLFVLLQKLNKKGP